MAHPAPPTPTYSSDSSRRTSREWSDVEWNGNEKFGSFSSDTTIDIKENVIVRETDEVDRELARRRKMRDIRTVIGGFMCIMSTGGIVNAVGLLQTYWESNQLQQYSPQTIGWIAGANIFLVLFLPVFAGPIFDRYGHAWLMPVGSGLFSLGIFIMSFFDNNAPPLVSLIMMILSFGVICGIGNGLVATSVMGLMCRRFDRRRGLACGFASLGSSLGGVMWPMLLRISLDRLGWSWSLRAIDLLSIVMLAIGNALVWHSADFVEKSKPKDEDKDATPASRRKRSLRWLKDITVSGARCFRKPEFVWLTAALAIIQFVIMGIAGTLPSWGVAEGFDSSLFFYIVAVVNAGSAAGRVVVCSISDWIGRFNSMILVQIMTVAVSFGLFHTIGHSVELLYAFAAIWGFAAGAGLGMTSPLLGELCKPDEFGQHLGANSVVVSIAGLLCVPFSARMLGCFGPTNHVLFFGTLCAISLVCTIMARLTLTKWSFKFWTKV